MGEYLTGRVRLEQTDKTRVFRILDNELYKDDDGCIYLVPRYLQTDNYTIPLWIAWLGGSPVDYRVEPSHLHDFACYSFCTVCTLLNEKELLEKEYLRYSDKRKLWICENIPKEYLVIRPVTKMQANNLLFRAMEASGTPFFKRWTVRLGVALNLNWYIKQWRNAVIPIDLNRIYDKDFWDFVGNGK